MYMDIHDRRYAIHIPFTERTRALLLLQQLCTHAYTHIHALLLLQANYMYHTPCTPYTHKRKGGGGGEEEEEEEGKKKKKLSYF
jgi:hypothetical protein